MDLHRAVLKFANVELRKNGSAWEYWLPDDVDDHQGDTPVDKIVLGSDNYPIDHLAGR